MEFANRTIATAMLAIGKVTPLSPEGQPPWPPFSWVTRPRRLNGLFNLLGIGHIRRFQSCLYWSLGASLRFRWPGGCLSLLKCFPLAPSVVGRLFVNKLIHKKIKHWIGIIALQMGIYFLARVI